jgi:hypothetical protein
VNRTTLARRYAPLAAVIAVQLLLVVVVPSTNQRNRSSNLSSGGGGPAAAADVAGVGGNDSTAGATGPGGVGSTAGAAGSAASAVGASGAAAATSGGGTGGGGSNPGVADTTHCVNGREFDPAIAYYAPPCVAGTPGAALKDNGGKTYQGVSPNQITIVDYVTNYGAEVNAILQAQGTLVTYDQAKVMDAAFEKFINDRYVLYGRKVHIITYAGTCTSVPPDQKCLLPEMGRIVSQYQPYIVFWNTTLCSDCFKELARLNTIAVGGIGFSDEFTNANAPFIYSSGMSSSRMERLFAEFWCTQLSSQNNSGRVVSLAPHTNPAQDFNGQKRVLGVISTNDPDNQDTVKNVLFPELKKRCGETVTNTYYYAQDINTAATQTQAGIAAMDDPSHPATTVLCLCDSVAPQFLYKGEQDNNYYPENILADVQQMGFDTAGQSYEGSLACPQPGRGCEYDDAFGLTDTPTDRSQADNEGVRIFKAGGGGSLPITPLAAGILAKNWIMMANLIENTGPALTPQNMQARAPALGSVGGNGQPLLSFAKNNYNWTQDVRLVYFNKNAKSAYNGSAGAYVNAVPNRFAPGQFGVQPAPTNIPGPGNRV